MEDFIESIKWSYRHSVSMAKIEHRKTLSPST